MKSENNYLVSVIVPIYNVQDYLEECLLSIINQTYKNIEIICVDDGSTDNSFKIANRFSKNDKRLKVYKKDNGGLSSARNYGIEISKGDFVVFVDSDDYVDKNYVKKLLFKLIENNCDTCICSYYTFDDITKQLNSKKYLICEKIFNKITIWENQFFNNQPEFTSFYLNCAWCKIYKRNFLVKNNFLNKFHEDEYMSVVLYNSCNRILITTEKLYFYRVNRKGSIINKLIFANEREKYLAEIFKFRYDIFKNNNYPKKIQIFTANSFINSYINEINSAKKQFNFIYMILFSIKIMFKAKTKYNIRLVLKLMYRRFKNLFYSTKYLNKYKISVIIPIYNAEKYLRKCLDSVINQSYKNLEIILINDGSTDNSLEIIKQYSKFDNRIKIYNQKNQGGAATLNNGIKLATGDYIHFLDSDDYLENGAYELLINKINSKKNIDLCLFCYNAINLKNNYIYSEHILKKKKQLLTSLNKTPQLLLYYYSAQWMKFYKASLIKENNLTFDNTMFGYDMLFHINALNYANKTLIIDKNLVNYRVGDKNSSSGNNTRTKFYSIHFDCFNNCINKFKNENEYIKKINICRQYDICLFYLDSSSSKLKYENYLQLKEFSKSFDKNLIDALKAKPEVYEKYLKVINGTYLKDTQQAQNKL